MTENHGVGGSIPPLGTITLFNILIFLSFYLVGHFQPFRVGRFCFRLVSPSHSLPSTFGSQLSYSGSPRVKFDVP